MRPELLQAILIDILNHARSATGNLPSLPQALDFSFSVGIGLALHVVIIVGFAAVTNEVGRAHQWR